MNFSIDKSTLDFLIEVGENNNRPWFQQNKERYAAALENYKQFIQGVIAGISEFDSTINSVDPNQCIYRIYRDVRFSPDKSPYKRHLGAYITPQGKNSPLAGYYVHIEPFNSMISGGIYLAPTKTMQSIRKDISYYQDDFLKIVESPTFSKNFTIIGPDSLKKLPRGFEAGSKVDSYLMMRHISPAKFFTNDEVLKPDFFAQTLEMCKAMYPLIQFINRAINNQ